MRNIIIILFLLIVAGGNAVADLKSDSLTTKVIIYYYYDESSSSTYRYYSHIIAESVVKELKKTTNFTAGILPETQKFLENTISPEERKHYIETLSKQSKKYSTRFFVIGSYSVVDGEIRIKTQVFDALEKNYVEVRESRAKVGASLVTVVDEVTAGIHIRLSSYRQKVARYKNEGDTFYGAMAWSFGILSATGIGSSIYFNMKVSGANEDYRELSDRYNSSTNNIEASQLRTDLESTKKDIDKYHLYRSVSLGVTGVALLTTGYFTYKYISSRQRIRVSSIENQEPLLFVPVCGLVNTHTLSMDKGMANEFYYGGLITYRF